MAEEFKFQVDPIDKMRFLITVISSFIQERLVNKQKRTQQREHCTRRFAAEDEIAYSDEPVLSNLHWGIIALEKAMRASDEETKMELLDYAEKMLKACAMLNTSHTTAGVPNSYLSALAYLNLSYVWKLRKNVHNAVVCILDMFIVDPFYSRIDFGLELWEILFLPHMSSILRMHSEERLGILMDVIPDSCGLHSAEDFDQYFDDDSLIPSSEVAKLQEIEQLYGKALDDNTRLYADYYKDCLKYDSATTKKVLLMLPNEEPLANLLENVSQRDPDHEICGLMLPNDASFSRTSKSQTNANQESRLHSRAASSGSPENYGIGYPNHATVEEEATQKRNARSVIRQRPSEKPTSLPPVYSSKAISNKNSAQKEKRFRRRDTTLLRTVPVQPKDNVAATGASSNAPYGPHAGTSPPDTDNKAKEQQKALRKSVDPRQRRKDILEESLSNVSDEGNQSDISLPMSNKSNPELPKDFICPITSQFFSDPVTLETGQTYERRAIQEWFRGGNTTCPITRQPLSAITLPKTNYILKKLITTWKRQHPDVAQEYSYDLTAQSNRSTAELSPLQLDKDEKHKPRIFLKAAISTSPTSVLHQAANTTVIDGLKPYISCLCNSDNLQEREAAVLKIATMWADSKVKDGVLSYLTSSTIVNGFIKIFSDSSNQEVLRTTTRMLSMLIYTDESVIDALAKVNSYLGCLATLLKNGLAEVAVLIYLLRLSSFQLSTLDIVPSLTQIISGESEEAENVELSIECKDAALALLEQMITGDDYQTRCLTAASIISNGAIMALLKCLDRVNRRQSSVEILLGCIRYSRTCRSLIARRIVLSPVLELFHGGNNSARTTCINFFSELVRLSRRTSCNRVLQRIKDDGVFSTMHTLLVELQLATVERKPAIASLLLQLDLLVEPREVSIYRIEAIETLIKSLRSKSPPASQMMALDALLSLPGHFDARGKSAVEAWLLKIAGFDQTSDILVKSQHHKTCENALTQIVTEEEQAAISWQKKASFVLCSHEKGIIFRALEECLTSNCAEMTRSCIVMGTWLVHMLYNVLDIELRDVARKSLLRPFINVLLSSKDIKDKMLAILALRGFLSDPAAHDKLGECAKQLYKTLRKLKLNSTAVIDVVKALINLPSIHATEFWNCTEGPKLDATKNGEVLSMVCVGRQLMSSHSDGTIKMWHVGKQTPRIIQEAREHTSAVTSLCLASAGDRLFSGSLDKTIRIWAIKQNGIHCIQVHDVKEPVVQMSANACAACFSSQGTGVKVYYWTGQPKETSIKKTVKCLELVGEKLYCGCANSSIQEVDINTLKSTTFYTGARGWLGSRTIHSLAAQDGRLFAGCSSFDGIAVKVYSLPSSEVLQSMSTGHCVQKLAVNKYFTFAATKVGVIVWLNGRASNVGHITIPGMNTFKITSLTSDANGQMLGIGCSDGKIQAHSQVDINSRTLRHANSDKSLGAFSKIDGGYRRALQLPFFNA